MTELPDCALGHVLGFLSYDQVSKMRLINRRMNRICGSHLTRGFKLVEKYHSKCLKEIKSKLPRRESERKSHPLSRHCDILTAVETRLSLLSMTFLKFVDAEMCCFIPGKVIDEIYSVLKQVKNEKEIPPRPYEILQVTITPKSRFNALPPPYGSTLKSRLFNVKFHFGHKILHLKLRLYNKLLNLTTCYR